MSMEIARTEVTVKDDSGEWDWMCATVTTTLHNGHYTVQTDNIPEDLIPPTHHFSSEEKAIREHFTQVQYVHAIVADVAAEQPVDTTFYRQPVRIIA